MSAFKQVLLSLIVVAVAGALWLAYDRGTFSSLLPGGTATSTAAGPAAGGPAGGPPAGRPAAGGFRGGGRAAAPIVAASVETDDDGFEVQAIGTVAAAQAVTLYAQVAGVVAEVMFQPGTEVADKQTLVRLADSDQQVALDKAKIALDSAQAALDRAQQLAKNNNITNVALRDAQTAVDKAEIDYRSAQLELAKRTVTAPFAGMIGLSDITVGDVVNSSKAIATLDDVSTVSVSFDVPERASGRVAVGQQVTATTEALVGRSFVGTVSAVDSRVDPVARTLRVMAKLPNDANVLKPGMALTVSMDFVGEMHPVVPSLAVQYDRLGAYVWKVADSAVHRVGVDIVGRRSGTVIVVADLQPGDLVASEGLQRLREGARVDVVDDGSGQAPAAPAPQSRVPEAANGGGAQAAPAFAGRPRRQAGEAPTSGGDGAGVRPVRPTSETQQGGDNGTGAPAVVPPRPRSG